MITDHGVIEKLARLADTESDMLRSKLAEAIANCCDWSGTHLTFNETGLAPFRKSD